MSDEVLLHGGLTNAGRVTRVGDTVRRPPSTAATWALLEHLERVGFDGAPRFLGVDDQGREILSFLPGEAAIEPVEDWALSDEALVSVAELLRRYHAAVASFDPTGHAWPDFVPAAFRDGRPGGLTGPAVAPVALRCVTEVARALPAVPVIGCGGVHDLRTANSYLDAGAAAVQVGTALLHDPTTVARLRADLSPQEDR